MIRRKYFYTRNDRDHTCTRRISNVDIGRDVGRAELLQEMMVRTSALVKRKALVKHTTAGVTVVCCTILEILILCNVEREE